MEFLGKVPWLTVLNVAAIFILPKLFFPEIANLMILLTFFLMFSCSNLPYHTMRLEVHSMIILLFAILYGALPAILISILMVRFSFKLSIHIGLPSPILALMDAGLLSLVAIFGSLIPQSNYFIYGIILLIVMDILRSIIKYMILHKIDDFMVPLVYASVNYILLRNFGGAILAWLSAFG